jgi:hypothetical protein
MDSTAPRPALLLVVTGDASHAEKLVAAVALENQRATWLAQRESLEDFSARLSQLRTKSTLLIAAASAEQAAAFEQRTGWRFDVRVGADDPDAAEKIRRATADFGEWTRLGLWGGAAGGIEVSVGSLLHAAVVPLRGLALSSTQAAVMTFASAELSQPGRVLWVPLISAGLKAFSPGGGRVRPMLAISVQGALYSGTVQMLGWNVVGVALGGALVGAWAALQGFFIQYLLLGEELTRAYDRVVAWLASTWHLTAPSLPLVIASWAFLHAAAAAFAASAARRVRRPPAVLQRALADSAAPAKAAHYASRARRIGREFLRWQLWLPLAVVSAVMLASGRAWEDVLWLALRFLALALVTLALLSLVQPAWIARHLRRRGWWGPAAAFDRAMPSRFSS